MIKESDETIPNAIWMPVEHVQGRTLCARKGVTFEQGDIFLIRIRCTAGSDAAISDQQRALPPCEMAPVMELLLDNGKASMVLRDCAALAGTTISIEQKPCTPTTSGLARHGRMFDLEALRARRVVHDRWIFFFASVPLRVPGGVASPTNGSAIF
ncbi:hypothetical protein SPBR_09022 [Sporothrix brasiliensis 5110]|uniref:Uncharacterized protein n=1 Tax=Sporothrix brasiliensis 5110 TaxID=1398154 RepID=A0A0C2IUM3_9PEZI|nr:uncharacterized protein SPBR_09022 [Sporothrix brasiliensis 5110]KIH90470.1 hypothetical protein SPBR_09022 [Sporothrix brasiliensis 5110]